MTSRKLLLHASVARNYGPETVTFSVSEWVELSDGQSRRAAQDNLYVQCRDAHEVYSSTHLKNVPPPPPDDGDGQYKKVNALQEHDEVISIGKSIGDDGKVRYRAKTLLYRKYGVPIFDEVAEHYGIPRLFPDGAHTYRPPKGCTVLIDISTKNPKVSRIEGLE